MYSWNKQKKQDKPNSWKLMTRKKDELNKVITCNVPIIVNNLVNYPSLLVCIFPPSFSPTLPQLVVRYCKCIGQFSTCPLQAYSCRESRLLASVLTLIECYKLDRPYRLIVWLKRIVCQTRVEQMTIRTLVYLWSTSIWFKRFNVHQQNEIVRRQVSFLMKVSNGLEHAPNLLLNVSSCPGMQL